MDHQGKIQALLQPMLLPPMNRRRQPNQYESWFTSLDPKNPVCNFLIEYYGLKGLRGVKRLGRWSPNPQLLLQSIPCYHTCQELLESSTFTSFSSTAKPAGTPYVGILLEDVSEEDLATLLHLRGAILDESGGALYSPYLWMNQKSEKRDSAESHPASAYLWFRSILQRTLEAEPILHCHGLHEWAMQYQPKGQPPPPSSKYQSHLPLRVCRDIINETVERKGISCTHVDALRFFAPAAGPLNHHGASLERMDQLRLEQPACVHAHMDLLKIILRLQPFCDSDLFLRVLTMSLDARRLDVAASPYDARKYGLEVIPVETEEGRALYREKQRELMVRAEPIRRELLDAYNLFLKLAFDEDPIHLDSQVTPSQDRYATAEPGGKPWRRNLISNPS